jgi:hypothetical protein
MRLIRSSVVLTTLLAVPLVACGGDDGGKVIVPDAKVFMDAPPDTMLPCAVPMTLPGGSLGSDAMRQSANWIRKNMAGTVTFFGVTIPLDQAQTNLVTLVAIKQGASWTTNQAITFDPDPNSSAGQAFAFIDENYNQTSMTSDRTYWASTGTITFTEIAQTAGAKITFNTAAANFREVDDNGADVAGGCTSMLGALTAYLTQMTAVAFQPPQEIPDRWRDVITERVERALEAQ